jgi:hypothetical protein
MYELTLDGLERGMQQLMRLTPTLSRRERE